MEDIILPMNSSISDDIAGNVDVQGRHSCAGSFDDKTTRSFLLHLYQI